MTDSKKKVAKRPSMRKAVNDKCRDCIYDPLDSGTWRQQVQACNSTDCGLWRLRPLPSGEKHKPIGR